MNRLMSGDYLYNLGLQFYRISQQFGERTALRYPEGINISYQHLNETSNRLGRYLQSRGIKKGSVVAVFNEKSFYAYALMLSCLKLGVIYTNLDAGSPWQRIKKILDTCDPALTFFDQTSPTILIDFAQTVPSRDYINLQDVDFEKNINTYDSSDLSETSSVTGSIPAYIMFTSGSTGFPKGAVMSHDNVSNFIEWGQQTFKVTENDVFTNANPIYFDNSVFDFYTSLFSGATLVPLRHDLVKNATELVAAINQSGCTIWFSVPSLLVYLLTTKSLTEKDFAGIRSISFGGEGFPKNKLKQLYDIFGKRITLYNVYGPTECTCICSSYIISDVDFVNMNELAPLGLLAPNFDYEILPIESCNPDFGELALIGPCVGLGYYNDPDRTAQSFVQNKNVQFRQIMYKTGDVVERAKNGNLHFKGRIDNQIKHMGYRIELEEVEAAFSSLPYINEVGVVYEKINSELGQIKAFVSLSDATIEPKSISSDLRNLLPAYMIPRIIKTMEVLPKNANGKIDRKQLALLK